MQAGARGNAATAAVSWWLAQWTMEFPWNDMYLKEIQLCMSRAYGPGSYDPSYEKQGRDYPLPYVRWTENRNMEEFLRLVGVGGVQVEPADHAPVSAGRRGRSV